MHQNRFRFWPSTAPGPARIVRRAPDLLVDWGGRHLLTIPLPTQHVGRFDVRFGNAVLLYVYDNKMCQQFFL